MKISSIYDKLLPEVKQKLQANARKYSTAKRLKYALMSKTGWYELTITEVSDVLTYTDTSTHQLSPYSFMYGDNIISR